MKQGSTFFLALVMALTLVAVASADNSLDVVTNISGGGPQGQIELPACVQEGQYGMRIIGDDGFANEAFVQAGSGNGILDESIMRTSFWVNTDSFTTDTHGARHFLITTVGPQQARPFQVMYIRNLNKDKHQIRGLCLRNCQTPPNCTRNITSTLDLGAGWNQITMEWSHNATLAPNPPDGACKLSITGGPNAGASTEVLGRYNQYVVRQLRLGMTGGANIDPSTQGDMCFDDFQSFRTLAP